MLEQKRDLPLPEMYWKERIELITNNLELNNPGFMPCYISMLCSKQVCCIIYSKNVCYSTMEFT